MKFILIVTILLSNNHIYGNRYDRDSDKNVIEAVAELYKAVRTFDQKKLIESESVFERILSADANVWIAHYYIALADEYISHTFHSDRKKQEQYIDKGIEHLELCVKLEKEFSEAYIMLAGLYGLKIRFAQSQAISLSSKISSAFKRAEKLEPDNPRLYLISGRSDFYTPEIFGGGYKKAKEKLKKSLLLFSQYKIKKEVYPNWGHEDAYSYLGQIAVKEEQYEQASNYYAKALEIDSSNAYVKFVLIPSLKEAMYMSKPLLIPEGGYFREGDSIKIEMEKNKYSVYYTTDGQNPTINSQKYTGSFFLKKNTVVKAIAIANDNRQSDMVSAQFYCGNPVPSLKIEGIKKGLRYSYYEGRWDYLPDFDTVKLVETGIINKITLEKKKQKNEFGFVFSGYINIMQQGEYTFYLSSDDGSQLSINDNVIIDNDGIHSNKSERSYQIILDKGLHKLYIRYFDKQYSNALNIHYKGTNIKKQELSEKILFYSVKSFVQFPCSSKILSNEK
jgi:tetratricopeptide (TPR) repeat protein